MAAPEPTSSGNLAAVILPIATLVMGFVIAVITDSIRDKRALAREREARRDQRRDSLLLRRADFQRHALLELQESAAQLARMTAASSHEDVMAFRKTKEWKKQLLSEALNEGLQKAQTKTSLLQVRVRDEQVRALSENLKSCCASIVLATSESHAEGGLQEMTAIVEALNRRIGLVLRTLDDDEDRIIQEK
jgi:hypothetical protein